MDSRSLATLFYWVLGVILWVMQAFQVISIFNIYPDFLLLLSIIFSFSRGSFKGEIFAFLMGMLLDLMSGALFGLNAFIFTLAGACATPFQRLAKLPNFIVFVFYTIIVTVVKYVLYHIFFAIYQETHLLDFYFFLKIPGELVINMVFGVVLYILCASIDARENYEWF